MHYYMMKNVFQLYLAKPFQTHLRMEQKPEIYFTFLVNIKNTVLHIYINHWPSNYGGKEKAIPKRTSTAKLIIQEVEKLEKRICLQKSFC